jgi:hypothetical protein
MAQDDPTPHAHPDRQAHSKPVAALDTEHRPAPTEWLAKRPKKL